jgi:hypothetical protein
LYLDTLKALTEPTTITTATTFAVPYDEAIKWNLAVRIAPEYEKEAGQTVKELAISTLRMVEAANFALKANEVRPELLRLSNARYNIDRD